MTDETTTTDHTETIEKARDLLGKVTPGRWELHIADGKTNQQTEQMYGGVSLAGTDWMQGGWIIRPTGYVFIRPSNAAAIEVVPDLLAALVALADERDALRARVAELEGQAKQQPIVEIAPVSYGGQIACYSYRVLAYTKAPYAFGFGRDFTEAAQRADEVIEHFKLFGWGDNQP